MSKAIARAGIDTGDSTVNCDYDHILTDNTIATPPEPDTTPFITTFQSDSGATTVRINGYAAAIVDAGITAGQTDCLTDSVPSPHATIAVEGSETVFFEGAPVHRAGDGGEVVGGIGTPGEYSVNSDEEHNVFAG
jgi:uncharacterized Zn-binding protein involved in type VI secretion